MVATIKHCTLIQEMTLIYSLWYLFFDSFSILEMNEISNDMHYFLSALQMVTCVMRHDKGVADTGGGLVSISVLV